MSSRVKVLVGGLVLAAMAVLPVERAEAFILVVDGVDSGAGDVSNLISAGCIGGVNGPALTITGCLNDAHDFLINLTGDQLIEFAAGRSDWWPKPAASQRSAVSVVSTRQHGQASGRGWDPGPAGSSV